MANDTIRQLLSKIENTEIVLPEFQREFTWRRDQSRELIDSLLKDYPIGSLLLWKTADVPALKNMPDFRPDGRVEVLLDGQQRLTALYMLTQDGIPPYYSSADIESKKDPRNLYYNLETRKLQYYKASEMKHDPCWVHVTDCFSKDGLIDVESIAEEVAQGDNGSAFKIFARFNKSFELLRNILDVAPPLMYVKDDATLRHALTVFDRTNSNGTPLTEADIALAHMCSAWPDTRRVFKEKLAALAEEGFEFDLTFLIRAMNAVVNGRAEYSILHTTTCEELIAGWHTLNKLLDFLINFLRDRAYIYSTDDLNTTNVVIPVLGYLAQNDLAFQDEQDRKKLLYWMYAALYQRRYSGSVTQKLERDLNVLASDQPLEHLLADLREDHGDPRVSPDNLDSRDVRHPLYNMSVIVVRARDGVDWSNGLSLSKPFGKAFSIERHHIFPRSVLNDAGYDTGKNLIHRKRVNEIANRVPLTRAGNMDIFSQEPSAYFPIVEDRNPGNLEKFMIPMDQELWKVDNYEAFLEKRRQLIADAINTYMRQLLETPEVFTESDNGYLSTEELIQAGESETVEFKSTLRWHIYAERMDKEIQHASLKTIAAFLNSDGGTLLVGVNDDGEMLGLELDDFPDDDKMMLHLTNLVKDRIGAQFMRFLRLSTESVNGRSVLRVDCNPSVIPAYVTHQNDEYFYIRTGPATTALAASEIHDYIQDRFYG